MSHSLTRSVSSFLLGSILLAVSLAPSATLAATDASHVTLVGSVQDCTLAQNALKDEFEERMASLDALLDDETPSATTTYRDGLKSSGKWTDKQQQVIDQAVKKYEAIGHAVFAEMQATYNLIDGLCTTDGSVAIELQSAYYQTHLILFEKFLDFQLWMRKNLKVYNSTLPAEEQSTAKEINTGMAKQRKLIVSFKKYLKQTKKETPETIFTSPIVYPMSAY